MEDLSDEHVSLKDLTDEARAANNAAEILTHKITKEERQAMFLEVISKYGCTDISAAAVCGITRWAVIPWKRDPDFMTRYNFARKVSIEGLVAEAERRAMRGSDRMLEFLLVNYAPDRFSSSRSKLEFTSNAGLVERLNRGRARIAKKQDEAAHALAGLPTPDDEANALAG